jgi:hypothetical protein
MAGNNFKRVEMTLVKFFIVLKEKTFYLSLLFDWRGSDERRMFGKSGGQSGFSERARH